MPASDDAAPVGVLLAQRLVQDGMGADQVEDGLEVAPHADGDRWDERRKLVGIGIETCTVRWTSRPAVRATGLDPARCPRSPAPGTRAAVWSWVSVTVSDNIRFRFGCSRTRSW
jgi:hypothetical protein